MSTTAWINAAVLERAPARTFTAVRAIAAVAGMPPTSGAAKFASPCPNSSRSGSWVSLTLIASATVADSRLSKAASAATASVAGSSAPIAPRSRKAREGVGSPAGSAPSVRSGRSATRAMTVAAATLTREKGTAGRHRAPRSMTAATPRAVRTGAGCGSPAKRRAASAATAHTFSWSPAGTPSAAGTCCSAITTAMPAVKPSITGTGR
jgi:hypothetical protein